MDGASRHRCQRARTLRNHGTQACTGQPFSEESSKKIICSRTIHIRLANMLGVAGAPFAVTRPGSGTRRRAARWEALAARAAEGATRAWISAHRARRDAVAGGHARRSRDPLLRDGHRPHRSGALPARFLAPRARALAMAACSDRYAPPSQQPSSAAGPLQGRASSPHHSSNARTEARQLQ